jgi:hypothetical protein
MSETKFRTDTEPQARITVAEIKCVRRTVKHTEMDHKRGEESSNELKQQQQQQQQYWTEFRNIKPI